MPNLTNKFKRGDRVRKISDSRWQGIVVGEYSTELTPEGYAVESETEVDSVQIYPAKELELVELETITEKKIDELKSRCETLEKFISVQTSSFEEMDKVAYFPLHADVEVGWVSSINENFVFVKFDDQVSKFGWDNTTAKACDPKHLRKI